MSKNDITSYITSRPGYLQILQLHFSPIEVLSLFNPIVVGLFDSTILVGGGKKAPLTNSSLVIGRATKFGVLKASGMYFL